MAKDEACAKDRGLEKLEKKRKALVSHLASSGYLKGASAKAAMLAVPRECFVSREHFYDAYVDTPMPIPDGATISAPHMHAIYLTAAKMKPGDSVLEIGFGSGILLAYAYEMVKPNGLVVGLELSPEVFDFGSQNLERAGYGDCVELILGDIHEALSLGTKFDWIFVSATAPEVPKPLLEMVKSGGALIAPVEEGYGNQELVYFGKSKSGKILKKKLGGVMFVPLRGEYGF
jgi:protein-L-isoaspartate(D-aspartate) O-methyltransferase